MCIQGETPERIAPIMPEEPTTAPAGQAPAAPIATPPAVPTAPATTTPPANTVVLGPDGQPFSPERAMATITTLRAKEKALEAATKELETFRKAQKDAEDAQLSENTRLAKQLAESKAREDSLTASARASVTRLAVELAASKHNLIDTEAAFLLLDKSQIVYDDGGHPTNVDALVKALASQRAYLVKPAASPPPAAPDPAASPSDAPAIGATNGSRTTQPAAGRRYTLAEFKDHSFFRAHKEDMLKAERDGRIDL